MLGSMKPCCARPNIPLHPRHGRRERISQMREAGRALCPRQIARLRCHEMSRWLGYAFCSKVPQSVDSHKGALGVRGLLRDASIYRPSNRREAEREAANRFAGIRPHAAQRSVSRCCERCHVGQSPALPSPRLDPTPSGPSSTARRYARGEQRDRVPRRSASAYRPSRCGEGRVPRVPSPAVTACGCTVQRTLPRAPWAVHI